MSGRFIGCTKSVSHIWSVFSLVCSCVAQRSFRWQFSLGLQPQGKHAFWTILYARLFLVHSVQVSVVVWKSTALLRPTQTRDGECMAQLHLVAHGAQVHCVEKRIAEWMLPRCDGTVVPTCIGRWGRTDVRGIERRECLCRVSIAHFRIRFATRRARQSQPRNMVYLPSGDRVMLLATKT